MNPRFFTAPFYFAFIWFRVQGSRFSWRLRRLFFRRWYSRIAAFPSRGRCPEGADRVTMAWKTAGIRFPGHSYESCKSPAADGTRKWDDRYFTSPFCWRRRETRMTSDNDWISIYLKFYKINTKQLVLKCSRSYNGNIKEACWIKPFWQA